MIILLTTLQGVGYIKKQKEMKNTQTTKKLYLTIKNESGFVNNYDRFEVYVLFNVQSALDYIFELELDILENGDEVEIEADNGNVIDLRKADDDIYYRENGQEYSINGDSWENMLSRLEDMLID